MNFLSKKAEKLQIRYKYKQIKEGMSKKKQQEY